MKGWKYAVLGSILCLLASPLFAGSITNEGPAPVKVSGRSTKGISGGGTLRPGQTIPMRQHFLWLEHVPEGPDTDIRIKIVEDNGATGYITTSGGKYTCTASGEKGAPEKTPPAAKSAPPLQPGYVTNHCNIQLYVTFISSLLGSQRTQVLMPSQTITVPKDTVEVRTQPLNSTFKDTNGQVEVLMPDGSRQSIPSSQGSVYLGRKASAS